MQPRQLGIVHFDSQPHGASIIVDGQILTDPDTEESIKTPATVSLYEGRRDFILRLEGHNDVIGYVDVLPGVKVNIFKNMTPGKKEEWTIPEPQIWLSPGTGMIRVYSFPDSAEIYIDGNYIAEAPVTVTDVPEGTHRISFRMPGMMIEEKTIDVTAGAWSDISATMRPELPKLP